MAFNILIVDDSRTVRAMIGRSLRMAKVPLNTVFEAENGKVALEILDENWMDLILVDINMPVMNGVELIERLKEHGTLQTVPVVIVSTESSEARIESLMSMGVRGRIRKPFTPEQIRDMIGEMLGDYHE